MAAHPETNYDMQPAAFVNHYPAMPSLPVSWTMRSPLARAFAVVMPTSKGFSVIVTGNRFILDVAAGLAIVLMLERHGRWLWRWTAAKAWASGDPGAGSASHRLSGAARG